MYSLAKLFSTSDTNVIDCSIRTVTNSSKTRMKLNTPTRNDQNTILDLNTVHEDINTQHLFEIRTQNTSLSNHSDL